jgi:protein phosphatase
MGPVEADVFLFDVEPGDRFLLCSDGLSGVVDSDLIAAVLGQADPTGAVTQLVDFALERGAPDNVTVVVADVVRVPDEMATNVRPTPVVVGAAAETRVRLRLPYVSFPADAQPDPDRPDAPPPTDGPPTAPQPLIDADLVVPASQSVFGERDGGAPRRRGRLIALVAVLVVMGLALSTGLLAANSWRLSRWYLGVNGANVAVYHGIPGAIGPIPLSDLVCDSGIPVALLPEIERSKVQGSQLQGGRADIVARLSGLMSRLPAPMVDAAGCAGLTP